MTIRLVMEFKPNNVGLEIDGKIESVIDLVFWSQTKPSDPTREESPRYRLTRAGAQKLILALTEAVAEAERYSRDGTGGPPVRH